MPPNCACFISEKEKTTSLFSINIKRASMKLKTSKFEKLLFRKSRAFRKSDMPALKR